MAVVSRSRRARLMGWLRAHRLVSGAMIFVIVVLLGLEVGVRVVTPDAMEVVEYNYYIPHPLLYDHLVTNPAESADAYRSLTETAESWNTIDPQYGGWLPCEAGHILNSLPGSSNHPLVVRFLWRGLPVAVATHTPVGSDSGGPWTCEPDDWYISAGGVPNPRPYASSGVLQSFPSSRP